MVHARSEVGFGSRAQNHPYNSVPLESLTTAVEIGRLLVGTVDIDDLLADIAWGMCRFSGCSRCAIAEYDPETLTAVGRAGYGLDVQQVASARLSVSDAPIALTALKKGGPVVVHDPTADNAIPHDLLERFAVGGSLGAAPLASAEFGTLGLALFDRGGQRFDLSPIEQRSAALFADLAALAIQNALFVERSRALAAVLERSRIAGEVHDGVSQLLFTARLDLDEARAVPGLPPAAGRAVDEASAKLKAGADKLRLALFDQPEEEQGEDTLREVRRLLADFTQRTGISGDVDVLGVGEELTGPRRAAVIRAVREGLRNVEKHANATEIEIRLRRGRTWWVLELDDDGDGDTSQVRRSMLSGTGHFGFGLSSIVREVARLDGRVWISSSQRLGGISLSVSMPVRAER